MSNRGRSLLIWLTSSNPIQRFSVCSRCHAQRVGLFQAGESHTRYNGLHVPAAPPHSNETFLLIRWNVNLVKKVHCIGTFLQAWNRPELKRTLWNRLTIHGTCLKNQDTSLLESIGYIQSCCINILHRSTYLCYIFSFLFPDGISYSFFLYSSRFKTMHISKIKYLIILIVSLFLYFIIISLCYNE